ncbi:Mg-chelatase subunit ChlD [Clostridium punense]|uniref:Mg-chelatase subunit ChlD n=1 Tax=Clostridium punense TaxID=1054297 RepID=A0ABS4K203_9CLOT|nr:MULTISPECIES: VWA domain-containing protein [Clostridium]EQB87474.1 hypothetical protein M918_08755 [Clostridium sp. BL8]MBP2020719.1 Mg-chelatase subunit ChlD [Clostridium punense]
MKKISFKNKVSKMMVAFLLIGFLGMAYNVKATVNTPDLNIAASISKSSIYVNEEFQVTYRVQPQPLGLNDINKKANKEIILVIDTSGSMNEYITNSKTRIQALKEAANNFIDKFKNEATIKIGIVTYDYYGRKTKALTEATSQSDLKNVINGLSAEGATNIGDGIRVANSMFSSDASTKKYLVLMSDGMPTALSYTGEAGGSYKDRYSKESYYKSPNIYWWESFFEKSSRWQYYTNTMNTQGLKYGTYGNTDPKNICLEYSTTMASELKKDSITNYIIGFSGGSDSSKLTQIATASAGTYYDARSATAISQVYSDIGDKIKADYSVEGVKVNFTLPNGLEYVMDSFDTSVNGNDYSKSVSSISYKLNSTNTQYIAEAFDVTLKFKGITKGYYELSGTGWNISYKDVNGNIVNKLLPKTQITIEKYNTEFAVSRRLLPEQNGGKYNVNNEFQIEYSIVPQPIKIETTQKTKEIMLVVDTSGSMAWSVEKDNDYTKPSRIELTKTALNNFINKFSNAGNVKIGLITYADKGRVYTNNSISLFDYSNILGMRNTINGLTPNGGTNIGDGLRRAAWALSSNKDANKYIVMMTDGEPTFYSYYDSKYYTELDNKDVYTNSNGNDYEKGLEYTNLVAGILRENKDLNIKTFSIGFSKGANAEKLREISTSAGGEYFDATSNNIDAINEVYSSIADQIKTDISLSNVKFSQTLPDGLVLTENGSNSLIKDLRVNYTYNNTTKQYEAEPINFTVNVKGTKVGNYELSRDAKFTYTDFDGTPGEKVFDSLNISILDTYIIKQGLFQPNGNNPNIIHVGEKNIKYISDSSLNIAPKVEYQLAAFIRTNGQDTSINIKLNLGNNVDVTKIKVASVNVYSISTDGSLVKLTSSTPIVENDESGTPNIKVTLAREATNGYKYYIINYNYMVADVNEGSSGLIINRAGITDSSKYNDFQTKIVAMPDVF